MSGLVKVAITSGRVAQHRRTSAGAGELGLAEEYKISRKDKFLRAESRSHSG